MPPTVWCAQHAVRFPFNPGSDEQTCPAGHSVRLEGVVGYCPTCDMQWDVREVEQPETCPYCQTGNVRRHLCHTCQRLTYLPPESADTTCQGCGTPFAQTVLPHACRVLRAEVVTGRQVCPACQESIRQRAPAPTTKQSTNGVTPAAVPAAVPAAASETGAEPTAGTAEDTGGIRLTGPVRVRALHATYGSRLVRVHFDYNRRRFFRNEKGLFFACGVGAPPTHYHIIPSWSRFGVAGDFVHWFSEIFDCPQPKGGDIWVHAPAVADAEGTLLHKGLLEIDRPPEAVLLPQPQLHHAPVEPEAPARYFPSPAPPMTAGVPVSSVVDVTPATVAQPQPAAMNTRQPAGAPVSRQPRPARWRWVLAGLFLLFVAVGVGLAIYFVALAPYRPANPTVNGGNPAPVPRPNQPQTTDQTNQQAILVALEGLTLAFNGQLTETYATYFDRTLRPYGDRREAPARQVVDDLQKLAETYTVTMTHENPQVAVDAQGTQATVTVNRLLSGRHRQTGQLVKDTQRVTYRFAKKGTNWIITGISHPAVFPSATATPKRTPGTSQR
ncbi:hypothetical protein [Chloracidobacterium aggregatum]|uniref:Uncharacterized protein n=1 Tax=Chloracidobacterium sp. N TaxID=2821540 RepID=A0ABX8B2D7_9BACT|nr:hypothetical protein [Chloracidobacterium aggregatum]QUV83984.1 hypothetical protein J8C03_07455 [Chloracidobacterium sp. 2]QUV87532.1 hypothetical protein J8C07_10190 [Chloracidobacterium sp. S]QUV90431.1 hypothetical protein J8C04_09185 [Chloracidobacterium sp. A]QUV93644.1 hypothetical protein J8C05_09755 [Chloracidobacterium sp. N]QUV96798.1 hypothetical protein J8C00_10900 [Chloracidobacterium sp. E]